MVIFSQGIKDGATKGIKLCFDIIIPSLLPMLIILGTIINSNIAKIINSIFGFICEKLFHLPKCCASVIIFGLIGGYPAGAILTHNLYKTNLINSSCAKRLLRFNFCGGIAFIITAIGDVWLNNAKIGAMLLLINITSSLLFGIINGIGGTYENSRVQINTSLTTAITKAVESSLNSVLIMNCYIILFSAICATIKLPNHIIPIIEITSGMFCTKSFSFELMAFYLSFGGICVHFQLLNIIGDIGMKYYDFFISRLICGLISYFLGKVYTLLFPHDLQVFSNISEAVPKAFEVNIGLSTMFVIGSIILVLDIHNKKSKYI